MGKIIKDKQEDAPTIMFMCSRHGMQDFKSFGRASIRLKCGCVWHHIHRKGLQYGRFPNDNIPILFDNVVRKGE